MSAVVALLAEDFVAVFIDAMMRFRLCGQWNSSDRAHADKSEMTTAASSPDPMIPTAMRTPVPPVARIAVPAIVASPTFDVIGPAARASPRSAG